MKTVSADYALEYGTDTMEMHTDALQRGEQVLIVDDLIATGGTALAAVKLIESRALNALAQTSSTCLILAACRNCARWVFA